MTSQEYIATIQALVRGSRFHEAREFGILHSPEVWPLLTAAEFVFITDVMAVVDSAAEALDGMTPEEWAVIEAERAATAAALEALDSSEILTVGDADRSVETDRSKRVPRAG